MPPARATRSLALLAAPLLLVPLPRLAPAAPAPPVQRSRERVEPPRWDRLPDVFFADAFRQALHGPRPANLSGQPAPASEPPGAPAAQPEAAGRWPQLAPASVVEDEIKRVQRELQGLLRSERGFLAGDYRHVARLLGQGAIWFGVVSQFDQPIRWKNGAAVMAAFLARGSAECQSPTPAAYQAALACQMQLDDRVRGAPAPPDASAAPLTDWSAIASRQALMQRLQVAVEERLRPWSAEPVGEPDRAAEAEREARVAATLAQVLLEPGWEDAGDEQYAALCQQLVQAALEAAAGAEAHDGDRMASAVSQMRQACSDCHLFYRD